MHVAWQAKNSYLVFLRNALQGGSMAGQDFQRTNKNLLKRFLTRGLQPQFKAAKQNKTKIKMANTPLSHVATIEPELQ